MDRKDTEPRRNPQEQPQFTKHSEWYAAFLGNTAQKRIQELEVLRFLNGIPHMRERMGDSSYRFGFLFVGGGTGAAEASLVYDIAHNGPRWEDFISKGIKPSQKLDVYYNDPSLEMYKRFAETLEEIGAEETLQGVSLKKFEDPSYQPSDIDLALGFQMWYYVNGWQGVSFEQNSLVKLAKTVHKKNGVAVLSVQSKEGDLFALRGKQLPKIHGYNDTVAEEVTKELDTLGLQYQTSNARSSTNVESMFQNGIFNPTDPGKNILSFMLRTSWDGLNPARQQEAADDIRTLVERNRQDRMNRMLYGSNCYRLTFRDRFIYIPGDQPVLAA